MNRMAEALPVHDGGSATVETLRDRPRTSGDGGDAKVDVMKVLDRIAAALAALEGPRVLQPTRPITKPKRPPSERPRLRHNWG